MACHVTRALIDTWAPYKASLRRISVAASPRYFVVIPDASIMPIVGEPKRVTTTITGNVSDWSHSTIFTTSANTYTAENAPALTTYWTPPAGCSNRWMGGDTVTVRQNIGSTWLTSTPTVNVFLPVSTPKTGRETPSGIFVAFSTTPVNTGTVYDASYIRCQPLGVLVSYSPGICPQGQTVAEITEYHYTSTPGLVATRFSASCCQGYSAPEMTIIRDFADRTSI